MDPVTETTAPTPPEQTASLMDATVREMVEQQVAAELARRAQAPGGLLLVDPRTLPPPTESPPPELEVFTIALPPRFADYVRHRAQAHGQDTQTQLAAMVRWFWQHDLWRQTGSMPAGLGQPATSSLRT